MLLTALSTALSPALRTTIIMVQNGKILVPIQSTDLSRIAGALWFFNLSITLSIPFKSRFYIGHSFFGSNVENRVVKKSSK